MFAYHEGSICEEKFDDLFINSFSEHVSVVPAYFSDWLMKQNWSILIHVHFHLQVGTFLTVR